MEYSFDYRGGVRKMTPDQPEEEKKYCLHGVLTLSGINPTRVILWLVAIAIVSFAIGFGILAVSGVFSPGTSHPNSPFIQTAWVTPNTIDIPLDGAASGNISIIMGAGKVALDSGTPENLLMEATVFSKAPEWQPTLSSTLEETTKTVRMTDKGHTGKAWFAVHSPNSWEIRITDRVPVVLNVNIGAGDCKVNAGSINLTYLNVHSGAGDTEIDLGRYHGGRFDAAITSGIGDLTLKVPRSGNTRITVHQGVGDISGSGFTLNNGAYVTPGFNPALPVNEIAVKQGVGSFILEMV